MSSNSSIFFFLCTHASTHSLKEIRVGMTVIKQAAIIHSARAFSELFHPGLAVAFCFEAKPRVTCDAAAVSSQSPNYVSGMKCACCASQSTEDFLMRHFHIVGEVFYYRMSTSLLSSTFFFCLFLNLWQGLGSKNIPWKYFNFIFKYILSGTEVCWLQKEIFTSQLFHKTSNGLWYMFRLAACKL